MVSATVPTLQQRIREDAASEVSGDTPYIKFFTADGTGVADGNLIGNYLASATDFFYRVPAGFMYRINSVTVQIADNALFNQTDYGAISGGLANGVKFFLDLNPGVVPLLGGYAVKQNLDFFALTYHCELTEFAGIAQTLIAEFKLVEDYGGVLVLTSGMRLIVRLQDNFTTLVQHRFAMRGVICAC